jgi:hypothetical protein
LTVYYFQYPLFIPSQPGFSLQISAGSASALFFISSQPGFLVQISLEPALVFVIGSVRIINKGASCGVVRGRGNNVEAFLQALLALQADGSSSSSLSGAASGGEAKDDGKQQEEKK